MLSLLLEPFDTKQLDLPLLLIYILLVVPQIFFGLRLIKDF